MMHYRDFSWERWAGTVNERCRVSITARSYPGLSPEMRFTLPEWKAKGGKRVYRALRARLREAELEWLFGAAFVKRESATTNERFSVTYVRPVTLLPCRTKRE